MRREAVHRSVGKREICRKLRASARDSHGCVSRTCDSVRRAEDPTRPYVEPRSTRKEPAAMSHNAATLFDDASPNGDEYLLLDDLVARVPLGLGEGRPTPNGPVYALTQLGHEVAACGDD